jgi:hypothetical protein
MPQRAIEKFVIVLMALAGWTTPARPADTLEARDRAELQRYLDELKSGRAGSATRVDQLAETSFPGVLDVLRTYVALKAPVEAHTHRAFQQLLERTTREAYSPQPMLQLYAPEFARFLATPLKDSPLSQQLFDQLRDSGEDRLAVDLAVRLTPEASLRYLASGKAARRIELLEAWNRRLASSQERRPIPDLATQVDRIAGAFSLDLPAGELEPLLRFIAAWPAQRERYRSCLEKCLGDQREAVVMAGLSVQHRTPMLLEKNEAVVGRFASNPKVVERAVLNYAFDTKSDHSATLRRLWPKLPASQPKARRACLFAMGIHPHGNDAIALEAVLERSYDYIDAAMPVLKAGDAAKARQAIRHILTRDERGQEEALRLARDMELADFADDAVRLAHDERRDLILRQTALRYLQSADGTARRRLLSLLTHKDRDVRLAAIQMFADRRRLTREDRDEIGPALIRVAQDDASRGHRQEAIYALGNWRDPSAAEFLRKVLKETPKPAGAAGLDGEHYWNYRFRLVALLGLARLGDAAARKELREIHEQGGPVERMDVLLAFVDLGEAPAFAFEDLSSIEPRLVATAAHAIARHGDPAARQRLKSFFDESPLWAEFAGSGIDDYNILRMVGMSGHEP